MLFLISYKFTVANSQDTGAKILTTFTAGKLRLSYPESIIPKEIPF